MNSRVNKTADRYSLFCCSWSREFLELLPCRHDFCFVLSCCCFFLFCFLLKRHGCVFWIVQVIFFNKRVKLFYTLDDGIKAVVWIWIFSLVLILPVPWTHHCIYSWDRISSWNNYEERRKYEERKGDLALRRVTHCLGVESLHSAFGDASWCTLCLFSAA